MRRTIFGSGRRRRELRRRRNNRLKNSPQAMQYLAGAFEPPAESGEEAHFGGEERNADQKDENVAEKNDDAGKEAALIGDVGLPGLENVAGERDVKGVGGAREEVKPDEVSTPVPKKMTEGECSDQERDIEREEIRSERDEKIGFRDHDVSAAGGGLEFFNPSAEEPGPDDMSQFMAHDINPHRFGEEKKNHNPAGRSGQHRDPGGVGVPGMLKDEPESLGRSHACGKK